MITKLEVQEGIMIAKLDSLTEWQIRRVVELYVRLHTDKKVIIKLANVDTNMLVVAKEHFTELEKIKELE